LKGLVGGPLLVGGLGPWALCPPPLNPALVSVITTSAAGCRKGNAFPLNPPMLATGTFYFTYIFFLQGLAHLILFISIKSNMIKFINLHFNSIQHLSSVDCCWDSQQLHIYRPSSFWCDPSPSFFSRHL